MFFASMNDFWLMGGYAAYVWSAVGITLCSMLILVWNSLRRRRKILRDVTERLARQARVAQAKNMENTL
ncbi:heme exporter protein CcmD [Vibrio porteresiae]|uniref:Heme exporter protein D n=1 Tax=Vibrio porteresiae DSM 19223 TaxID=1123496 RepID=A0ABZ0QEP8_9VIBR|nr:heme exporter protein CcmD [Vibrio porteresiae]WPC74918.1 heme exporter protein CcmD [Vibrio porteresiae DSM 19223]